jgi:hypothetical protein
MGNQDLGSGFGMNNPDHIFKSLGTIFGLKYLNHLMRFRCGKKFGSGIKKSRIRNTAKMNSYLSFPCRNIARVAAAAAGVAAAAAARMSPLLKTGNGVVTIDTRAAKSSRRMLRPLPFLPLPSLGDRH